MGRNNLSVDNIGIAVGSAERRALEDSARAAMPAEYLTAPQLEQLTGTPASTWRYWAHIGSGPTSFKLGRRRVWKRSEFFAWLESQEKASA
jgi:predicted DNA-binding transcriptional regulator AlpA